MTRKIRNKKGFTLVELLIVIAVLGIIAAIAVPRFTGVLTGVKNKADVSAAKLWAKEIEAEFMVEKWAVDGTNGLTISNTAKGNFDGDVPKSQNVADKYLIAKITYNSTTKTYKLDIYVDVTTGTPIYTKDPITSPIE